MSSSEIRANGRWVTSLVGTEVNKAWAVTKQEGDKDPKHACVMMTKGCEVIGRGILNCQVLLHQEK
jgi:hypothetical protein